MFVKVSYFAQTRREVAATMPSKHWQRSKLTAGRKAVFGDSWMLMPAEGARELSELPRVSLARDELPYRRQQSLLGEFGRIAMQTRDYRQILQRATELCAQGLQARFAKVLEYLPDESRLMVRAGVGWAEDTIDIVSLAADIGSPAGYAYQTGATVIS